MIEEAFRTLHNATVLAGYLAYGNPTDEGVLDKAIEYAEMGLAELRARKEGPGAFTETASGLVVPVEKVDVPDVFKSAFNAS